ncbi:oligosaccharide repeat unit polymerase [Demequina sp. B12]|uniref:O-antigen polymerase n=1 Tax=Demequina sp. B12 TaxID=2992757 RepID=UPI00237AFB54|nr:O-antigen polymerase [Demequina sp. B12]MDE0573653.1 oligosaccharide repeat unit polymerase [Demequina sp. B12]
MTLAAIFRFTPASANSIAELLLSLVIIVSSVEYARLLSARKVRLYQMTTWMFIYLFLGVAPLVQLRVGHVGNIPTLPVQYFDEAAALVLLSMLGLLVGSRLVRDNPAGAVAGPAQRVRAISGRRTTVAVVACLAVAAAYVAIVSPRAFLQSREDSGDLKSEALGDSAVNVIFADVATLGLMAAVVCGLVARRAALRQGSAVNPLLLWTGVAAVLFVINPISSSRYSFGTAALALLAAVGAFSTVHRFRLAAFTAPIAMVVLFPILDTFRHTLDTSVEREGVSDALTSGDFDAFAQLANTVGYVSSEGLTWGYQLLGSVMFFVPRALWPSKPLDTGVLLAEHEGYNFTNLSAPLQAEAYINFGIAGVACTFGVLGYVFEKLDRASHASIAIGGLPTPLACVLPFYTIILMRGSLLQAMAGFAVIVAVVWWSSTRSLPGNHKPPVQRASSYARAHSNRVVTTGATTQLSAHSSRSSALRHQRRKAAQARPEADSP